MRILQVLEAVEGGTRTHLDQILRGLSDSFEFHLVYSLSRNPDYIKDVREYESRGIACSEIPMVRNVSLLKDMQAVSSLKKLINSWNPEIVHSHSSKAGFVARRAAAGSNSVSVYTPHCLYFPSQKGFRRMVYRWGEKLNEKRTDKFIAVSDSEQEDLKSFVHDESKIIRIDNGVDIPDASDKREKKIVFAARAARQKGWDLFLEIAEKVLKEEPDIQFVFAGGGPDLEVMKNRAAALSPEGKIQVTGRIEHASEQYSCACCAAVTSRWEGQPYSVLEALSHGTPVVAFDIPGMTELVEPEVNGKIVSCFDTDAFARALLELLHDSPKAEQFGNTGRERVRRDYTKDRFLEDMKQFYTNVTQRRTT